MEVYVSKLNTLQHDVTTYTLDFDKLPEVSKQYLIEYGIKQNINDCHSQHSTDKENVDAIVESIETRIKQLVNGTPPSHGGRTGIAPIIKYTRDELNKVIAPAVGRTKAAFVKYVKESHGGDTIAYLASQVEDKAIEQAVVDKLIEVATKKAEQRMKQANATVKDAGDLSGLSIG